MLVELGNRIVNTDHIVSAEPADVRGGYGWRLTLTRGDAVTVEGGTAELDWLCGAIVPAPPGFVLIEAFLPDPVEAEGETAYRESTILAFRIAPGAASPAAITIEGEPVAHEDLLLAIVDPNGRCVSEATPYDSLAEFKAICERKVARRREQASVPPKQTAPPPVPTPAPSEPEDGGETNPLLALRARIQDEPIEAPFPGAPWQPGRDFAEVLDEVRQAHPDLHEAGVGYSPGWGWKWEPGALERHRADMTAASNVEAFEAAIRFLSHAGREFARPRVNRKRTSYSWKHVAERVMGRYVPNGMLIAAAYALGFTVEVNRDSPNPYINLAEKAVELDPQRGA